MKYVFYRMTSGWRFKVEYWSGDEWLKASFHVNWKWRGRFYWFCLFLPDFMP